MERVSEDRARRAIALAGPMLDAACDTFARWQARRELDAMTARFIETREGFRGELMVGGEVRPGKIGHATGKHEACPACASDDTEAVWSIELPAQRMMYTFTCRACGYVEGLRGHVFVTHGTPPARGQA